MTSALLSAAAFIATISLLVTVHEFGHFWVARRLGIKVLRFSVGFGRPLVRWRSSDKDGPEYWIAIFPVGGYVKMLDDRNGPVPTAEAPYEFSRRPMSHRAAVLIAGPAFNFVFAALAYWLMFVTGVPDFRPVVDSVVPGTVAARAGMNAGDEFVSIDGNPTSGWGDTSTAILAQVLKGDRIVGQVRAADGTIKDVELDISGRRSELTSPDEPDALFTGLGIMRAPLLPAIIGSVDPSSPAEVAGLRSGDRVLALDGQRVNNWQELRRYFRDRPGETVEVEVRREEVISEYTVVVGTGTEDQRYGLIGAYAQPPTAEYLRDLTTKQQHGVVEAVRHAMAKTWETTALTVRVLGGMLLGELSLKNMAGPVGIATFAGQSADAGFSYFLGFLAVMSINLGIINLLPIPILDGGQLLYQFAEWLKGSPFSDRVFAAAQQLSLVLIAILMVFVFYNDVDRVVGLW